MPVPDTFSVSAAERSILPVTANLSAVAPLSSIDQDGISSVGEIAADTQRADTQPRRDDAIIGDRAANFARAAERGTAATGDRTRYQFDAARLTSNSPGIDRSSRHHTYSRRSE